MVMLNSLSNCFDSKPRIVDHVAEPIDRAEVLRYLGYPQGIAPSARVSDELDQWLDDASRLAEPLATYRVLRVAEKNRRSLRVDADGTVTEFCDAIGEFLGSAVAIGVFIATAGPILERRASELLWEGDAFGAMVLNAVGAERAEAAEAVVIAHLRGEFAQFDMAPTLPYSPGYCGMALVEQRKLFGLFAGLDVGVTLSDKCLMQPIKSVSGLIGLGPTAEVVAYGSPCDRCELHNCNMRR